VQRTVKEEKKEDKKGLYLAAKNGEGVRRSMGCDSQPSLVFLFFLCSRVPIANHIRNANCSLVENNRCETYFPG
jgi:hypothetical protein